MRSLYMLVSLVLLVTPCTADQAYTSNKELLRKQRQMQRKKLHLQSAWALPEHVYFSTQQPQPSEKKNEQPQKQEEKKEKEPKRTSLRPENISFDDELPFNLPLTFCDECDNGCMHDHDGVMDDDFDPCEFALFLQQAFQFPPF